MFREPDHSRGKPSSSLKNDNDYERIFNSKYPVQMYWTCAKIMKLVDTYMKSEEANLPTDEKYNLVFHVAMYVALCKMGNSNYGPFDIVNVDLDQITKEFLAYCLDQVTQVFHKLKTSTKRQLDVIAKSNESSKTLLKHFNSSVR